MHRNRLKDPQSLVSKFPEVAETEIDESLSVNKKPKVEKPVVSSAIKDFLSKCFPSEVLDEIGHDKMCWLNRFHPSLLRCEFSSVQLIQIISSLDLDSLEVFRQAAIGLTIHFKINPDNIFLIAINANGREILEAFNNCWSELADLKLTSENIMELMKLPQAAEAIKCVRVNYTQFKNDVNVRKNPAIILDFVKSINFKGKITSTLSAEFKTIFTWKEDAEPKKPSFFPPLPKPTSDSSLLDAVNKLQQETQLLAPVAKALEDKIAKVDESIKSLTGNSRRTLRSSQ